MSNDKEHRMIGYARVSTDDQDLSMQIAALVKYGVARDHIYEERASGGKIDRPVLNRALEAMREGDSIVIWKLDRLGRTLTGVIEVAERMHDAGVNLISLTEKIDTTSAMNRAFFQISLVFAELERGLISERTKAGMAVARARGAQFGRAHMIKDNQKRLDAIRPYIERGELETMTPAEALEVLNGADPKAKPIKSLNIQALAFCRLPRN